LVQAVAAASYMFAREQYQFYGVAIVFGFAYAGVMPLYAALVRENFPVQIVGTVVGAATMMSSLGMATGPLIGGVIFDTYGTYRWLYITSLLTGLAAAAIMLTFRPAQPPRKTPAGSDLGAVPAE
jgi:MFS family permease